MSHPDRVELTTGHELSLPLALSATAGGLLVTADATAARDRLPAWLSPVSVGGRTLLALVSVAYSRVGDDAMAPYDEVGVFLPARPAPGRLPTVGALGGLGGYTLALPVTTAPGRALGVDVWGYPKTVADITVRRHGRRRRTTLSGGGDGHGYGCALTLTVPHRPRLPWSIRTATFTDADGPCRQPVRFDGRVGVHPLAGEYTLGDHPLADRVRALDPGRVVTALSAEGSLVLGRNQRLAVTP